MSRYRVVRFASFLIFVSLSLPLWAVPSPNVINNQIEIRRLIQQVMKEHGFDIGDSEVSLIDQGGKLTIVMDVSHAIAEELSQQISSRIEKEGIPLQHTFFELNLFGASDDLLNRASAGPGEKRWNDALSKAGLMDTGSEISYGETSRPKTAWDEHLSSLREKARFIVVSHLAHIKEVGKMTDTVLMENYWRDVFEKSGSLELYEIGRPLVTQALVAGIKPYREGKQLNATIFAELAMRAIGVPPSLGRPASPVLLRP